MEKEDPFKNDFHSQLTSSNSERSREPKSRNMVQSELTNRLGFETKFSEKFEDLNRMNKDKEELKLIITQLIISQEQKNEIIKEYSLQIMKLNNDLRDKENEILVKNEVISRLKNKINEKKHKNMYNY